MEFRDVINIVSSLVSLATIGAMLSALFSFAFRYFRHEGRTPSRKDTLDNRVTKLTKSLRDATALITTIEGEINARSALATQLQKDVDKYKELVELKKPEVEAIAQLLRGELAQEGRKSFWKGILINTIFFVLGAGASWVINIMTMPKP